MRAWGSVLTTAYDLAVKLGCDPIVFIGADLAYTDAQPYCRGTVYEENWATAVAGGLFAMSQSFQPYIGFDFVIVMYAGVVLGGMGSILGAFWGGLTIGLVQQMSTLILPYQLQNTAIFVVFLIIVFFRPQGMFGTVGRKKV